MMNRELKEHVTRTLHPKELPCDPDSVHAGLAGRAIGRSVRGRLAEIGTEEALQRGRQVNVGRGLLLDSLKHTPLSARNDGM